MWHTAPVAHPSPADLDAFDAGQRLLLRMEREELAADLARGLSPLVCLSEPRAPKRFVRLTSAADLDDRTLPWAAVADAPRARRRHG